MWPARWGGSCNKEPRGALPPPMTNRIAIALVLMVAAFFLADHFFLHLGAALFLARQFAELVEYLAFWR